MKTIKILLIFAALIGLQVNHLFAEGAFSSAASFANIFPGTINIAALAPVTPGEATFEEVGETLSPVPDPEQFSPQVPLVADFGDEFSGNEFSAVKLIPFSPAEADFEDYPYVAAGHPAELAPGTPVLADFSDNF